MNKKLLLPGLFFFLLTFCKKDPGIPTVNIPQVPSDRFTQAEIIAQQVIMNPSGFAPLTAAIQLTTGVVTRAQIKVTGRHGTASDIIKQFDTLSNIHRLPVLGLYAGYPNIVELTLYDQAGKSLGSSAVYMQTGALSGELPTVTINISLNGKRPGMTLVSYLAYGNNSALKMPFMFDAFGDIRWYLDYSSSTLLNKLNYDNGVERLKNGNLYFGDISSGAIYEVNMFGEIINTWPLNGYQFHHKVLEKPNGNFLISVTKPELGTVQDQVIEIDRNSKQILHTWDLRMSLQQNRQVLTTNTTDWMHINAVEYDPGDNTIIVSGRTQGIVKLDVNNNVKWLMAPHRGWGISGNGTSLPAKLLKPIDGANQLITDTLIMNGYTNHPDFEWNWCQHAVKIMPNGDLTMFDNGDNRNYTTAGPYSRAVQYRVNITDMTVKQIWSYGKNRGSETYSRIVSDVDFHQDVNHIIFSPGAVDHNGFYGKVIELDYGSQQVLFEATVNPPPQFTQLTTFHRTERMEIYP